MKNEDKPTKDHKQASKSLNKENREERKTMGGGGGGTEAFPDLGSHCKQSECNQLDFLPFKCDGCLKDFCLEHRSYKSHDCPKAEHKSRRVVVCEICSTSIELTGKYQVKEEDEEKMVLEKHERSGDCDPSKKKKPKCPVKRCKQVLTFSNNSTCKICRLKVCLAHRFPEDHDCKKKQPVVSSSVVGNGGLPNKFLVALAARTGNKSCASKNKPTMSSSSSSNSVKAH